MNLKEIARKIFSTLHLDLTQNLAYDRLTNKILSNYLKPSFNCVDVGCHKGEILENILTHAPQGKHFAFEPIPEMYEALKSKFGSQCTVLPYALSDHSGKTTFNHVRNAPAYSGINKRAYKEQNPDIVELEVELRTLDEIIPAEIQIDLIKIDVEGGEFGVLKGAKRIISTYKPIVIFECGLGASEFYGTQPEELFKYLDNELGLKLYTLQSFLNQKIALSASDFSSLYHNKKEYYFIAN